MLREVRHEAPPFHQVTNAPLLPEHSFHYLAQHTDIPAARIVLFCGCVLQCSSCCLPAAGGRAEAWGEAVGMRAQWGHHTRRSKRQIVAN